MSAAKKGLHELGVTLRARWTTVARLVSLGCVIAIAEAACLWLIIPILASLLGRGAVLQGQTLTLRLVEFPQMLPPVVSPTAWLFALLLLAYLVKSALAVLRTHLTAKFQWGMRREWADSAMRRFLGRDLIVSSQKKLGNLIDDMVLQTRQAGICLRDTIETTVSSIKVVALMALLFFVNAWWGTAILATAILVGILSRPIWRTLSGGLGQKQIQHNQRLKSIASENILGLRDIKAFGAEEKRSHTFLTSLQDLNGVLIRQSLCHSLVRPTGELLILATVGVLVVIQEHSGIHGALQVPMLGFVLVTTRRLISLFCSGITTGMNVAVLLPAMDRIRQKAEDEPLHPSIDSQLSNTIHHLESSEPFEESELQHQLASQPVQDLVAKGVSFSYPGRAPVHTEATLLIPAGRIVAIVGPSGIGKSTVADILSGLLTPDAGEITYGRTRFDNASRAATRHIVGYVSQDSFMFNSTIRENLLLGVPHGQLEDEVALQACDLAGASEVLQHLPLGLDTVVGERGVHLSGGERQRLAIARVLIRDARILIFDEPTSGLDAIRRDHFLTTVRRLSGRRSIVIVTHDTGVLTAVDQVVAVSDRTLRVSGENRMPYCAEAG